MTLRRRLATLFAVAAIVGLAGVFVVRDAVNGVLDARRTLIDRVDPALTESDGLLAALTDQETGVRGFALTRDARFLSPYLRGGRAATASARALQRETRDLPDIDRLRRVTVARAEMWRSDAARPIIARARRGDPVSTRLQLRGKRRFDAFRSARARLHNSLGRERTTARARLNDATTVLIRTLVALLALAALSAAAVWFALTRWITDPLDRLRHDTRLVSEGDLAHEIPVDGPPEIRALGRDVEAMRARIVREVQLIERSNHDLARSNSELEQFAYVASHDLQEPLRKVAGFTGMLQRRYAGQLDERADQYIDFAVDGAKRMQDLINDLLAFSRVGRSTESFAAVDLQVVYSDALRDLGPMIEESGARIDADPLPVISGDRSLLTTALVNLLGNAIKFHGHDPPVVRLTCERAGNRWRLAVIDNGIGIEPEYADRVFVIFSRLHTRERYEGTGIGLALTRKIIEFHGGSIDVDRAVTTGTTMRLQLPAADVATLTP